MSNEIVVEVKTDSKGMNFDTVNRGLNSIGENARRSNEEAAKGFERARDSLGRLTRDTDRGVHATDRLTDANGRARESLSRFTRSSRQASDEGSSGGGFFGFINKLGRALSGTFSEGTNDAAKGIAEFGQKMAQTGAQAVATNLASTALSGGLSLAAQAAVFMASAGAVATAAFVAMAPALLAVGGAAGAAAAGLIGAASAVATLGIGFGGIGDALAAHTKQMNAAGGAAKNTGEQEHQAAIRIRDAKRQLVQATRDERDAIADVNRARQDEINRLKDLDSEIRSQTISQAEAEQALAEAKLDQAKLGADATDLEKQEAQTRVDRAQYELDETKRRLQQLTNERKKADKAGIDGSDQVQAALKRQAQAHEAVLRAQEALAEAQRKTAVSAGGAAGGINAFGQAMKKLSPNAQELVRALIGLSDQWDRVKKRVQDRLLAGAAESVQGLAAKWLPVLNDMLGKMADRLNAVGRGIARTLGDKSFIDNIKAASDIGGEFISTVGGGIPALLDGFARLAASSGPVLRVIGNAIRGIFEWFDKWIKGAEKSGALDRFMRDAAAQLDKIFHIGGQVFHIFGQLVEIIFPSSKKASDSVLDSVSKQLESVSKWLSDPRTVAAIRDMAKKTEEFVTWIVTKAIPTIGEWGIKFEDFVVTVTRGLIKTKNQATLVWNALRSGWLTLVNFIAGKVLDLVNIIDSTFGRIIPGLSAKLNTARRGLTKFRQDTNAELAKIKDRTIEIRFQQVGTSIGKIVGDLTKLLKLSGALKSSGGTIGAASGGARSGLTWVGEHGPELIDAPAGSRVYSNPDSQRMVAGQGGGGQGAHLTGTLKLAVDRTLERGILDSILKMIRVEIAHLYGGDVQLGLGS